VGIYINCIGHRCYSIYRVKSQEIVDYIQHWILFSPVEKSISYNKLLTHAVEDLLPKNVLLDVMSLQELPEFDQEADISDRLNIPEPVIKFRNKLALADSFIIISPEYNYCCSRGLKNALDWISCGKDSPIEEKPIALLGTYPVVWGTVRMHQAFTPLFELLETAPVKIPTALKLIVKEKFDRQGKLVDEKTICLIKKKLNKLLVITNNCKKKEAIS